VVLFTDQIPLMTPNWLGQPSLELISSAQSLGPIAVSQRCQSTEKF